MGEGGSCYIYAVKVNVIYVNSLDYNCYFKNEEKKEKLLAIKKLKTDYEKKYKHKLDH
jgi:hypothetical protein